MTKKGQNGLPDIQAAAYAELSYFDTDKPSVSLYEPDVTTRNGFVFYNEPKDILTEYVQGRSLGEHDSEYKSALKGGKVVATANKPNGFSAIAIEDASGQIIISYRGTDMTSLKDWGDNAQTALYAESSQSDDALSFFKEIQNLANGKPISLVGHSKGGELALKVALENIDAIHSVNTISAQPPNTKQMGFTKKQLAELVDENRDKFNLVRMEGDIVPFLGDASLDNITRVIDSSGYKKYSFNWLIPSHFLNNIEFNGENFVETDGENILTIVFQKQLETIFTIGQEIAYLNELMKPTIIDIVWDYLKIDEKAKIAIGKILEYTKDFRQEVGRIIVVTVKKVVDAIKSLYNKIFNKGKIVVPTPEIVVDINQLVDLSNKLKKIGRQVNELDSDLNYLYLTESFDVIKNLIKANMMLPSEKKINKCVTYLQKTAEAFNNAEKNIKNLV
jgi:hypothetical protein